MKKIDTKKYWDNRYKRHGISGKGAIGEMRKWKWEVIESFTNIKDVIDVGCGDLSFWGDKQCDKYTGIDFSTYIIEKNREKRPNWNFIEASATIRQDITADTVLCIHVLFHIMDDNEYMQIVENLAHYAKKYIFIYTWRGNPLGTHRTTDNKYQTYRSFSSTIVAFEKNNFKLLAVKQHKELEKNGAMYIFVRNEEVTE